MPDVTALGELLIDFAQIGADERGYPTMKASAGGAPANFLAALSAYGAKTALLGKVGNDTFGRLLISTVHDAGIDTGGIIADENFFTTLAFVTLAPNGERSFAFARKPGADTQLSFEELSLPLIDEAKYFHFGTLSLTDEPAKSATRKAVSYAKQRGKLISFDPNFRPPLWKSEADAKEAMLWGVEQADYVKMSDEEADFLFSADEKSAAQILIEEYGVSLALITMGAKGAYIANARCSAEAKCPPVSPIDTTGAGDICSGAALSRILKMNAALYELSEKQLAEIVRFAVTAASLSTEKLGGIPSICPENEVLLHI